MAVRVAEVRAAPAVAARRRRGSTDIALALVVLLGFATLFQLAVWMDPRRPTFEALAQDEPPYLAPALVRSLTAPVNGLVADWYWLQTLQYIGRKIEEQAKGTAETEATGIDRLHALNGVVLARLLDLTTTLDPRFIAAYELAAVVLPVVDAEAAVRIVERGVGANPRYPYLHQQLGYIHWQRHDYRAAAAAFRRGAAQTGKTWMNDMAVQMEARGGDRAVAREMYGRLYQQAADENVKQLALARLWQVQWFEDRDVLRRLLDARRVEMGACPERWSEVGAALRTSGLRVGPDGAALDPSGLPYILVVGFTDCDVALDPRSTVPRK